MQAGGRLTGLYHQGIFKLLCAPTYGTDQMVVVMLLCGGQLKTATALGQFQLPQQVHGAEQPQGAIHRGQGYLAIGPQQLQVHIFCAQVMAATNALKQIQHPLPLGGESLAAMV